MNDKNFHRTIRIFIFLLFSTVITGIICDCTKLYIDYLDKESKRAIMFKIIDSDYVCDDILKFAEENL